MPKRILGIVISCAYAVCAYASDPSSKETLFRSGLEQFRAGNYVKALSWFEQARRSGMQRVALTFNLAVTHYKLKNYRDAERLFLEVAKNERMTALAYYNLGLVKLADNKREDALTWFQKAASAARENKIRTLAGNKINELQKHYITRTLRQWRFTPGVSTGYIDNLLDVRTGTSRRVGDHFREAHFAVSGPISGNLLRGWRSDSLVYVSRFEEQENQDISLLSTYLARVNSANNWRLESGAGLERSRVNGTNYLQTARFQVNGRRRLSDTMGLQLRYRYSDIEALDDIYQQLEGAQHRFESELSHSGFGPRMTFGYRFSDDDRNDLSLATSFSSFSPRRHRLYWKTRAPLSEHWDVRIEFAYTDSRYPDPNLTPDGISISRQDEKTYSRLQLNYHLSRQWALHLEYRYTDNNSTIDNFTYHRNYSSVGLFASF